jgi:uncharacterized protein YjiS (DUF1127 family)
MMKNHLAWFGSGSPFKKERIMFDTLTRRLIAWRKEQNAIRRLMLMDDYLLHDMGTSRDEIRDFVRSRRGC